MKNQALISSKDRGKTLKCHLLQFLFGALRGKNTKLLDSQFGMMTFLLKIHFISLTHHMVSHPCLRDHIVTALCLYDNIS